MLSWCILFLKIFLLIWPNFFWHQISEELLLTDAWEDFPNQSMGLTEIEGVNEKEEMHITDVRIWNSKVLDSFLRLKLQRSYELLP